jgi:hypothetical protein
MHDTGHRHPVLELFIDDAVSAEDDGAGGSDPLGTAAEDVGEHTEIQLASRESDDIQCCHWVGAHCVDVAQGIGCSDLPEGVWVIDDWRKKIHGIHDRQVGPKAENSRIVGRLRADNQVRMFKRREAVQYLQQVGRAELRRSTGGGDLLRQPHQLGLLAAGDLGHMVTVHTLINRRGRLQPALVVRLKANPTLGYCRSRDMGGYG